MSGTARPGSNDFDNSNHSGKLRAAGIKEPITTQIRIAELRVFKAAWNASVLQYRAARSGAALLSGEKDKLAIAQRSVLVPHETDSAQPSSKILAHAQELSALPTEKSTPDSRR